MIAAALTLALAAASPAAARPVAWSETELVVAAAPGPVFWRASRGASEVWILGVPDAFYARQHWEPRRLTRLLAGARELIMPPEYRVVAASRRHDARVTQLEAELPADLRARMAGAVREAGLPAVRYLHLTSLETAFYLRHDLERAAGVGTEEPDRTVRMLAAWRRVPVRSAALYDVPMAAVESAEPALGDCVDAVLADAAFTRDHARAASRAWAAGDLRRVRAESAEPTLLACMEAAPVLATLQRRAEDDTFTALSAALEDGGRSVAMLTLDTLLKPQGVLARLRAAGVEVTAPDAASPSQAPAPVAGGAAAAAP